jgi:hypothetical protein
MLRGFVEESFEKEKELAGKRLPAIPKQQRNRRIIPKLQHKYKASLPEGSEAVYSS